MSPNIGRITQETLDMLKTESPVDMIKAWVQPTGNTTGIQNYDLERPALSLFPVLTPLLNDTPFVDAEGGIQANWHAITGINTSNISAGLSEANRGGAMISSTADYFAAYRSFGLDDYVTDEAMDAAKDYMDLLSRAQGNLLWAVKLQLEKIVLGGQGTYALGQTAQPTVADVGAGGALAPNTTYSVIVVGLTLDGWSNGTVVGGVPGLVSRTNMDGSVDTYGGGTAQPSANRTVTTANDGNNTHSLTASVANQAGAVAYAWFWGAAGSEKLGAITTINSVVITAAATGTQTAASLAGTDNSQNALVCDGLLAQIFKPGLNAYIGYQATGTAGTGTPLTSDSVGGIVEIDAALQHFWDALRLSPTTIWVNSQEQRNITKKVLANGASGAQRFMINVEQGNVKGGDLVTAYLNKFALDGAKSIPIKLHPNLPPGTILFDTTEIPYPLSGVNNVRQFRCPKNFWATLWPRVKRRYEFGVYLRGVLQNYFPPSYGVITNIGNG
jgi:hypothetical protein